MRIFLLKADGSASTDKMNVLHSPWDSVCALFLTAPLLLGWTLV